MHIPIATAIAGVLPSRKRDINVFRRFLAGVLAAFTGIAGYLPCAPALAEETSSPTIASGWTGTVAAGPVFFPRYVGGRGSRAWLVPVLSVNYQEVAYVEFERAGAYLLSSADKKIGLGIAVEPRVGFTSRDGDRLNGMAKRRDSLEGGPTLDWDFDVAAISFAYFGDLTRNSRGRSLRAALYKPLFKSGISEIGILFAVDRVDQAIGRYYFGVSSAEATSFRPAYQAGTSTNPSIALSGTADLGGHRVLVFGAMVSRLGKALAASPIVEIRHANSIYLGYGWSL